MLQLVSEEFKQQEFMEGQVRVREPVQMMVPELTVLKSKPVLSQHQPEFVPV